MYFQSLSERFLGFKGYARYRHLQITILQQHVTLVKILLKDNFHCYRSNVFSKSLWMGWRFRSYDTRCLEFCRMSNYRNCRCLFWSVYVTLAKLIICKVNFHCHRQNVFESFSECFSGFKTYGTDQLHQFFSNIKLGRLQIIILK